MKTLKFILPVCILAIGIIFYACEKENMEVDNQEISNEISDEVLQKIESLYFNTNDVTVGSIELPDGSKLQSYIIEGDIAITPEQLEAMEFIGSIREKQYRTYNLVTNNQTIDVIGYTGGGNALTSKMQTTLQWAINNYNRLDIGLSFNLTFGTNYQSKDIVVYKVSGGGGMAGFPSGGKAYKWVQIGEDMDNYNNNVIEHVITHEIGHCLGLRHTDWWSRQSCGGNNNEGQGSDGAVHIPGTPTGYDATSLMKACFSGSEDGEFNYYDKVAFEYLY